MLANGSTPSVALAVLHSRWFLYIPVILCVAVIFYSHDGSTDGIAAVAGLRVGLEAMWSARIMCGLTMRCPKAPMCQQRVSQ